MKHLSDEEIQNYLDGNIPNKKNHVENHLRICTDCQTIFNQYKDLYINLEQEPQFQFAEKSIRVIMKNLGMIHQKRPLFQFAKNFLLGIGILWLTTMIISIAYLINSKPWEEIQTQSSNLLSEFQSLFFVSIEKMLSDLIGKPYLLLFAGLTILTVAIIDHLIIQPKFKDLSLKTRS